MKLQNLILGGLLVFGAYSCSNLEEELRGDITGDAASTFIAENADVSALLQATYDGLQLPFQDQSRFWAASEHTTDECMGPTRGPDWDDNGIWRVLHNHTWNADHAFLTSTFNELLQIVFNATNVLSFSPSESQAAEARYLRAFAMFSVADGWGQVPFREAGEGLLSPPRVLKGEAAIDFIISELNAIKDQLPEGPAYKANRHAARALLMKCYINKGTFANRTAPTFPSADMNNVISLADELINSGNYSLSNNFFDNFAQDNDTKSTELIFTNQNIGGQRGGNVRSRWFCGLHYNQQPSGWNGFCTIADFYNKFEDGDSRKGGDYAGVTEVSGLKVGFLVGQQKDKDGNNLNDRKGNPLSFTTDVNLIETGNDLEVRGIRVMKYPPDLVTGADQSNNDYVIYRYADVLLMKAEALLRNGNAGDALTIVNQIRSARGAAPFAALTLDNLIDERGRELYWEGHRRQDLIRFGKYLQAWGTQKPQSGAERLLFPIPNSALAVNPNLEQNPGY